MITGTSNYDEVPTIPCKICGGYFKADDPENHNARASPMSNIDKLNDHELVDLKRDIERELKRRAEGPKSPRIMSSPASQMLSILLIWTAPYVA